MVHIDPGPIPTLIPSAPTSINSLVASAVTTLPAIICVSENSFFNLFTASITCTEWPWAVSITIFSTSASIKD